MLKKYIFTSHQIVIALLSLWIMIFANQAFFIKLFQYAFEEKNIIILLSAPFVFVFLLIGFFNFLLLLTYRSTFKVTIAIVLLISSLGSYFMDSFHIVIDKEMFNNIMQTDSAEILDLFTIKLVGYIVFFACVPIVILSRFQLKFRTYSFEVIQKCIIIVFVLSCSILFYMSFSKSYSSFFRNHHELKMYLNPYYPMVSFIKWLVVKSKTENVLKPIAEDAFQRKHTQKKLMIFIVGETARAANYSLNGYEVPTNPLMQARNDIVNFSQFYSCGTATAISVPCLFSKFGREEFSDAKNYYENLVDVLAKTGVRVIWRDNNSGGHQGVANRMSDVVKYGGKSFDAILLQDLQASIDTAKEDTFVVLHLEGSHGPTYFKRYPDTFKKFLPTCDTQDLEKCSQEQIVNTYNNTLLYTDFMLNESIKLLEENEGTFETALFYVSDHGESLGENGVYLHGLPYFIAPDTQKHVPALFYFGQANRDKLEKLNRKKAEAFSHDNVFHTMLGLFDIQTQEYKAELDMLAN